MLHPMLPRGASVWHWGMHTHPARSPRGSSAPSLKNQALTTKLKWIPPRRGDTGMLTAQLWCRCRWMLHQSSSKASSVLIQVLFGKTDIPECKRNLQFTRIKPFPWTAAKLLSTCYTFSNIFGLAKAGKRCMLSVSISLLCFHWHFLSKWPLMEISTSPLSLEYRIWCGCISRLRARGSERVRSTPSEFLVLGNCRKSANFPKLQTLISLSSRNRFRWFKRQSCEIFRGQRVGELG